MSESAALHFHSRLWGEASYYGVVKHHKTVLIDGCENFQKRSSRNRYAILGPNGRQVLTVPLVRGKNSGLPIKEVRIAYDEDWVTVHLRSLKAAYGKAPFFDYYFDQIKELYARQPSFLYDLNVQSQEKVVKWLRLPIEFGETKTWPGPECMTNTHPKKYPQVFEQKFGFVPDLSVLDLLFCMGPEASMYLPEGR